MTISKKIALATAIIFTFTFNAFSIGAGVQTGFTPSFEINQDGGKLSNIEGNLTGTVKLFRLPVVFGAGLEAGTKNKTSGFTAGISAFADYWALDIQLKNTWNLYSGFGISCLIMTDFNSNWTGTAGFRTFAGCNWLFYDNYLEYYVQLNAVPSYTKLLSGTGTKEGSLRFSIPLETGVRLHF